MPGCYGRLAIMSFGDCTSRAESSTNVSMESLNQKLKTTVANNNNSSEASIIALASQEVILNEFPSADTPDLEITQGMNLKIASNQQMQTTLTQQSMDEVASKLSQQLDQKLINQKEIVHLQSDLYKKKLKL